MTTHVITLDVDGDGPFSYAVEHCPDGMRPIFSTNMTLDPDVKGAGLKPIDPKQFMTARDPAEPLVLNKGLKHYYSVKTRAAGEKDLKALCTSEKFEEGFYFIEGRCKAGKPLAYWFEVGYDEKPKKVNSTIDTCFSYGVQYNFSSITGISHYHFHPVSAYKGKFGTEYPSGTDFRHTVRVALENYDKKFGFNPEIFDVRVVTHVGVYTMKPDFDAIRANPDGAEKDVERYEAFFDDFFQKLKGEYKNLSQAEKCKLLVDGGSSKYVKISFQPF
jgi:hypothetical protein